MARGLNVRADVLAGLTVTLVGLPQCLAYALMSGLPPAYGLSTAAVAGFIAAIAGKSPHVVTGPTNTTGLLILAALAPFLGETGLLTEAGLPALATLTLMAGLVRIIAAYVGGAKLLRYLPESVLAGFTAGAGVLIGIMQLDEALGLTPFTGGGLWSQASGFTSRFSAGQWPSVAGTSVTIITIALIALGRRFARRWPIALFTIVAGAVFARFFDVGLALVRDRAAIPSGWPPGALPSTDPALWMQFALPSLAIVLLGTLELTVSARAGGDRPDMRREILAQGWANVGGAFLSTFPASASLTRSALLRLGGAETRLAAASAALMLVPILLFGGQLVGYIPQSALAGVLLITAANMINRSRLARIWTISKSSRTLLLVTFIATLTLPLEVAILIGCGLGLIIHLSISADPKLNWLMPKDDMLTPIGPEDRPERVVVEVSGTLYYAAAPVFFERLERELPATAKTLVVDVTHAHQLRFAALEGFEQLSDALEARGMTFALSGVSKDFEQVLTRARSQLVFAAAAPAPTESAKLALALRSAEPSPSAPPDPS